jgi:hypothetical protein
MSKYFFHVKNLKIDFDNHYFRITSRSSIHICLKEYISHSKQIYLSVLSILHPIPKDASFLTFKKKLISTNCSLLSSLFDEHKFSIRIRTRQYFKISNLFFLYCFVF